MSDQTANAASVLKFEAPMDGSGEKIKGTVWQTPDGLWNASIDDWFHATGETQEKAIGNVVKDYADAH